MGPSVPPAGLSDSDHRVRLRAIYALVEHQPPQAGRWIRPLLRDREALVRSAAIAALGELRDQDAVDDLVACLVAPTHHERKNAVRALAALGAMRQRTPLIAALQAETEWSVRADIIKALVAFGDDDAVIEALMGRLADEDDDVRATAAVALGRMGAARALPALRHMAASDINAETTINGLCETISWVAQQAIAMIEAPERVPQLDWPC